MAMPLALIWDLIAVDNASAVFKKVSAEAGVASKATTGLGTAFLAAGAIIGVAAIGVGVVATKMAADFQDATTKLVTGAGESVKNIELVKEGLLAMAPAVGIGPTALAKAMFMVESAGYRGAAGLVVMKAAAEGARIGGADATVVANGLTTALTDYHMPTSRAAEITSKLVATVAAGKTNMADLTASISGVLPFASALGIGFNDIMGAMATMTSQGISAEKSSTMLRFAMMSLANETPKGEKALKSVGLTAVGVHDSLGAKGLSGTLAMISDALANKFGRGSAQFVAGLADIVGGTRGMGATLALTGQNMATYLTNIKNISAATTEAGGHVRGWGETQKDFNTVMDQGKALLSSWMVTLGLKLLPVLTSTASYLINTVVPAIKGFFESASAGPSKFAPLVAFIQKNVVPAVMGIVDAIRGFIAVALPIVAEFTAGMMARIRPMLPTIMAIFTQIGSIVTGAMGLIATVIKTAISVISFIWSHWGTQIMNVIQAAWSVVIKVIQAALTIIQGVIKTVTSAIHGDWSGVWKGILTILSGVWDLIKGVITGALGIIKSVLALAWAVIATGVTAAWNGIIGFFRSIPGRILGALGDLGSLLLNAGSAIMGGFLSGITSGFDKIKNFVGGIASWIGSHKGPLEYDRQLLVPHGNAIMAGLNDGLTGGFGKVQGNVGSMAGRLSIGSLDFASSSVRSSAVGGGGATSADIAMLGDRLEALGLAQTRMQQTMQRQMAGA
jgi:TP901 family phage tail tape measure protein